MIDIYDEVGYIKNVLSEGLSQKWERDVTLLTRYYKIEGIKKSEARNKIKEKCLLASTRKDNPIGYKPTTSYKRLNKIFENAWKVKSNLRQIHQVEISKEVLDWFLGLEKNYEITEEQVIFIKRRRPGVTVKSHPITWNRTKYLFTLYIWTKIQENYLDKPYMHYLKKSKKRFKEDANLNSAFSMQKERDVLCDLGMLELNYALGINAVFIANNEVFKIPITDDNRVVITCGEPPEGELYNPGYWLEKQKMGSFVCQCCGKEFAYNRKGKNAHKQKYCKKCSDLNINGIKNIEYKYINCIDCDKEVEINKFDYKTCRCAKCQIEYNRKLDRIRKTPLKKPEIIEISG